MGNFKDQDKVLPFLRKVLKSPVGSGHGSLVNKVSGGLNPGHRIPWGLPYSAVYCLATKPAPVQDTLAAHSVGGGKNNKNERKWKIAAVSEAMCHYSILIHYTAKYFVVYWSSPAKFCTPVL